MLELNVAPALRDLLPAIGLEFPDEILLETDGMPGDTHPVRIPQRGPRAQPKAIAGASVAMKANRACAQRVQGLAA